MHGHSRLAVAIRPSALLQCGDEARRVVATRRTSRPPSAKRREVFGEAHGGCRQQGGGASSDKDTVVGAAEAANETENTGNVFTNNISRIYYSSCEIEDFVETCL